VKFLPDDYLGSWTLASPFKKRGVCLHTGDTTEVRVLPSQKPGFHVSWIDKNYLPITLQANQVRHTSLCTTVELGKNRLSTVEHLLAALVGCGLTHVHIQVSGNEIPLLDGSALPWVESITEAGMVQAASARNPALAITNPVVINRGESVITATPAENFKIIGIIDFPYKAIGQQMFSIELSPKTFVQEIAPARTFGFKDQINNLKKMGLIQGGCLDNALVCNGDSWLNPPLRFIDEPVRHKLLDLIGDLAFVGLPKAQIVVYKGSHALHADLVSTLLKNCSIA
tara:strand:- start:2355 stop:3206 length:852 start_codon:yes stop_codon:yes gene_type:complete